MNLPVGVLRFVGAGLLVAAATIGAQAADNVQLTVQKGVVPGDVQLDWAGGTPMYAVYRSADKAQVVTPANKLGDTAALIWLDAPPPGTLFLYRIVGLCQTPTPEVCDGVDDDCNGFIDNGCPGTCVDDAGCSPSQFCDVTGLCVSDFADGGSCARDAQCDSAHCSQGLCCQNGDCCATSDDCSGYSTPSTCNSPSTCQGTRTDGICQNFTCASEVVDDDSGCAGQVSNTCGFYNSIQCTAAATQTANQAALCPSECAGDVECDPSAHCDGNDQCVDDIGQGGSCGSGNECESTFCVDDTCCNDSCAGTCRVCDLSGSVGSCANVPNGQDVDAECGPVSCVGTYHGFVGSTCFRKADVTAAQAACNGAGGCRTAAQECALAGQGPSTLTCNAICQQPTAGTCTGTTAGSCTNINPGNSTCGLGACQRTVAACTNGSPNTCTPGNPTPETCNGIDDNCNGTVDDGAFGDSREPNNACGSVSSLNAVGSDQTLSFNTLTLYGSGDFDHYVFNANETDSVCGCGGFSFDEDYNLNVTLTVPSGAGSYEVCSSIGSCAFGANCATVTAGSSQTITWFLDGSCTETDSYQVYVRVRGVGAPGFSCAPYTLSYNFDAGFCR
jgi:putative metal-binding protein